MCGWVVTGKLFPVNAKGRLFIGEHLPWALPVSTTLSGLTTLVASRLPSSPPPTEINLFQVPGQPFRGQANPLLTSLTFRLT